MIIAGVVRRLQQGRVPNVAAYGTDIRFDPPYVIAKLEGSELRVWAHFIPDHLVYLEQYWATDLPLLLNDYEFTTVSGRSVRIYSKINMFERPGYSMIVKNKDTTISKERRFDLP